MSNTGFIDGSTPKSVTEELGLPARTGVRTKTPLTATIALNGNLSAAINIPNGYRIDAIVIPSTWVTANLTMQGSYDNSTYYDLYTYGSELSITATAGKATTLGGDNSLLASKRYVKFRSGTASTPVTQTTQADIIVWLVSM